MGINLNDIVNGASDTDILEAKKLILAVEKGQRVKGATFLATYNKITGRKEKNSSCSSCWKRRVILLKQIAKIFKEQNIKDEEPVNLCSDEDAEAPAEEDLKKVTLDSSPEIEEAKELAEDKPKRRGRPKGSKNKK